MEYTLKHTDLIYSALDIILDGDGVNLVIRDKNLILFRTDKGNKGAIVKTQNEDMEVIVSGEVVYVIEKEVYKILNYGQKIPSLEVFTPTLINLYHLNLQPKSKILVGKILEGIAQMVIYKIINVDLDKTFGHFSFVRSSKFNMENFLSAE